MELIDALRNARPGIAVTSDVMVGFPGETEEDFELTMDLIRKIQFDNLFSFKYSDREGTPAAKMGAKSLKRRNSPGSNACKNFRERSTLKKNRELIEGASRSLLRERARRARDSPAGPYQ